MKYNKKIKLSLVLAIVMVFGMLPMSVFGSALENPNMTVIVKWVGGDPYNRPNLEVKTFIKDSLTIQPNPDFIVKEDGTYEFELEAGSYKEGILYKVDKVTQTIHPEGEGKNYTSSGPAIEYDVDLFRTVTFTNTYNEPKKDPIYSVNRHYTKVINGNSTVTTVTEAAVTVDVDVADDMTIDAKKSEYLTADGTTYTYSKGQFKYGTTESAIDTTGTILIENMEKDMAYTVDLYYTYTYNSSSKPDPRPDPEVKPEPEEKPDPEIKPDPEEKPDPENKPTPPPVNDGEHIVDNPDGSYTVLDENDVPLGKWRWDENLQEWIFDEEVPLGTLPATGDNSILIYFVMLILSALGSYTLILKKKKSKTNH